MRSQGNQELMVFKKKKKGEQSILGRETAQKEQGLHEGAEEGGVCSEQRARGARGEIQLHVQEGFPWNGKSS